MKEENTNYQTSESAVYRTVGEELVVIHVDTGHFYYFNQSAKPFLDYFKSGQSLGSLLDTASLGEEEREYLKDFCRGLMEKQILQTTPEPGNTEDYPAPYHRPEYLRTGERKLEEIASDIAVLTQGFF